MRLDDILSSAGKHKTSRRIGRGTGSGRGKTCGRGHKGAGSRSGWKQRLGYEGGQTPFISRIPKRGFSNAMFKKDYQVVNISALEETFDDGAVVDTKAMLQTQLVHDPIKPVKILGNGEIKKKLTVIAAKFSASAVEKISTAGGTVQIREPKETKQGDEK